MGVHNRVQLRYFTEQRVYWRNNFLKVSVDAKNMADQLYYDFSGVVQPRHWVSATVQFTI